MAPSSMAMPYLPPLISSSSSRRPATTSPPLISVIPGSLLHPQGRTELSNLSERAPTTTSPPRPTRSSPPASRAQTSTNWRTGTLIQGPPPPSRPVCIPGRVVRLPEESEIPATSRVHKQLVGRGNPWNHPVVITGAWEDPFIGEQLVTFRACTSFGGQGLEAKNPFHHHYFVRADESTLVSGSFIKKENGTFVNCSPDAEFEIEFKHLQIWTGTIQFSQEALDSFNKNKRPRRDSGYDSDYSSFGSYGSYGSC
ncbi:hypothetical protein E8E12_005709 [Didymella heteroderae]|uniref:Uncharacterized protein n=1 Tax=Didymella heteroderae TaxID=1769908 RepID=A0A9P4WJW2_9PLEO|nr:hypothetical protein E8E12_005709 [Didymella heteroderae]